jgi:uncharacterized protein (DUF1499 family)
MIRLRDPIGLFAALLLTTSCAGTRPTDIGVSDGSLTPCPSSPNCVSSGNEDEAHRVAPLALSAPPMDAWKAARSAVLALPGTIIVAESKSYLHAESTSDLMGYVDDLELHLVAESRRIDVRSASRVGYGDAGVNRARVEALREALVEAGAVAPSK